MKMAIYGSLGLMAIIIIAYLAPRWVGRREEKKKKEEMRGSGV
jgi:hypothetical protein